MARKRYFDLGEENWGQKVRRAYYTQREMTGRRYADIAQTITDVAMPCYVNTLQRLEKYDTVPTTPRQRTMAYLAVLAYGYDPEDFGLTKDMVSSKRLASKEVADLLLRSCDSSSSCAA